MMNVNVILYKVKNLMLTIVLLFTMKVLQGQVGWKILTSNLTQNQHGSICSINKDTIFVIADNGKFLKTYNGGANWISQNTGFAGSFFDLAFSTLDTGYAVGQNGTIIKTTNGGLSWVSQASGTNRNLYSISIKTANNIWAVGDSGVILNSNNFGATWKINNTLSGKKLNSVRFRDANIGFIAGNNGTLLRTLNGGVNWNTVTISTTADLFSLSVTPKYAYLIAGTCSHDMFNGNEFFKTSNTSWVSQSIPNIQYGSSSIHFPNDSVGFIIGSALTSNGDGYVTIIKTKDFGKNWVNSLQFAAPMGLSVGRGYSKIMFINNNIGYALSGNLIFKTIDGGTLNNIEELNNKHLVTISPNPFHSSCILQFGLDFEDATITIYNELGLNVRNEKLSKQASYQLNRNELPIGMYYIQFLNDKGQVANMKFIIE